MENSYSVPIKGVLSKLSIRDLDIKGKKVFIRVDFNVPLDENLNITDDRRIRSALPTINYAMDEGAKVILASHLGRPKKVTNDTVLPRLPGDCSVLSRKRSSFCPTASGLDRSRCQQNVGR